MDWSLAPRPTGNEYLGPLQAMAAGRQAAIETRKAQARSAALGKFANGDLVGAQQTAIAGGDLDLADTVRQAEARQAAGGVIGLYGQPNAAAPQTPVQSLIAAGTPVTAAPPKLASDPLAPLPEATSAMADHTHEATAAIGHAALSGQQVDPSQAWAHLYSLDPTMGDKMMAAVKTMDGLRVSRLAETTNALAAAAQSLINVPAAQRQAQALHLMPQLAAHGVTQEMLANADLSDQGLQGIIGQSIGVQGLLDQANKNVEFGFKDREVTNTENTQAETVRHNQAGEGIDRAQLGETSRHNRFEEGKPIAVGFGTSLVRPGGGVVFDGTAGGGGGGAAWSSQQLAEAVPFGGRVTSGVRSEEHNKAIGGVSNSQHVAGTAIDVVFPRGTSVEAVQKYYADRGAPVKVIHERAGDPHSTGDHFHIQAAPGAARGANPAIEGQARAIADGRMPPLVGRAAVTGMGGAVMRRALEINPQLDGTTFATDKAGRVKFTSGKTGDTIRSLDVAVTHLDQLQTLADALHNGNTPLFNRVGQAFAQSTGSAVPTNFDSVKQFVTDEVTKAVIGSGGGVGDREHAASILSRVQSPDQLAGAIYQIKGLMAGQLNGLAHQYKNSTHREDFGSLVSDHTARVLRLHTGGAGGGGVPRDISAIMAKYR